MVLGIARSATKKRSRERVEDDMAEMSSMSESEIRAVARTQTGRNYLILGFLPQYSRCGGMLLPLQILFDPTPSRAVHRCNISAAPPVPPRPATMDDCAAVALERIEPDGSPTRQFPPHQVRRPGLDPDASTPGSSIRTLQSSCQARSEVPVLV